MNRFLSTATLACAAGWVPSGSRAAYAEEPRPGPPREEKPPANDYARKGIIELGGSLSVEWDRDVFLVEVDATVGWYVADRFELSFIPSLEYRNTKLANGSRREISEGAFLVEPSYHLPLKEDELFLFGGVGAGVAYDFSNVAAELKPRVGFNIEVGRSGVFTPALDVPILLGRYQGSSAQDPADVLVGVEFEAGFTTTF
jgi:hypothetical protein